ncbi:hypothetical protein BDB00DRAFT_928933 [Zychaea mexicana]|uniref:uncharacterized protein n=1 Tax=Zychaea mexicana TaxID=64656 RepID=UPI0022FE202D|nr:uncharacterized protein BDB00DRAFT_928933 [Zychaea mexicana]KAI9493401.1 hypothetical protein BDB00DRAFT_928933 [Zychaea mexicana]
MEKSLLDYDQSLEALERQRKELELVYKKMGQEWEASGAGIGWLEATDKRRQQQQQQQQPPPPTSSSGPSPEYLRSLLNVNEALLAQSLANTSEDAPAPVKIVPSSCPLPSPNNNEPIVTNKPASYTTPPITPDESHPLGARLNYTHTMDPIAELKASSSSTSSSSTTP